jgi:ubiquinone biosynthesis protein
LLSARVDLLPERMCRALAPLQDRVPTLSDSASNAALDALQANGKVALVTPAPIAGGTVGQIHLGRRLATGELLAIKILRPNVRTELERDSDLFRLVASLMSKIPVMSAFPVERAVSELHAALTRQCDFQAEMRNYDRLRKIFSADNDIVVPKIYRDLCSDVTIAMDYVPRLRKVTDPLVCTEVARRAVLVALRALYRLVFVEGFVHCDLHPGNLLVDTQGRVVIIDAGFIVEITESVRYQFAEFFFALAVRDSTTAARIMVESAEYVPSNFNFSQFRQRVAELICQYSGRAVGDFIVASFVWELFQIMRRHDIRGAADFTMIVSALAVFEGTLRQRFPELKFQEVAIPFVIRAFRERSRESDRGLQRL